MSFSIIIPCYNAANTLPRALDAVLSQKDLIKEIILIDDGSQDNTLIKIKPYLDHYPELIQYHQQPNQGPAIARNQGIARATGDYTLFLDADDAIRPKALSQFHQAFKQHPDVDLLLAGYCSIHKTKKTDHFLKPSQHTLDILQSVWFGKFSPVISVMPMRTHVLQRFQYPTTIRHGEDIVFFSQLVSNFKLFFLDFISMDIYHHTDSLRHQTTSVLHDQDAVIDLLFNPTYLPKEAMRYRNAFHAKKMLSLARMSCNAKQEKEARRYLKKAIQLHPSILLRLKTWKILCRSFV